MQNQTRQALSAERQATRRALEARLERVRRIFAGNFDEREELGATSEAHLDADRLATGELT